MRSRFFNDMNSIYNFVLVQFYKYETFQGFEPISRNDTDTTLNYILMLYN